MTPRTSSRFSTISGSDSASRFSRRRGSVFDGRTLKCQSSKSIEMPSRCDTRPPCGRIALLQLLELERDVGDRRVDLAGEEEALADTGAGARRASRRPGRASSSIDEERDDAGVRLREVPEVVVRRDLAPEHGVLRAHALLDERVPDAVHERDAAGALDRLRHAPARADVVDDLLARRLGEDSLGHQRGREVTRDELARCRPRRSSGRRRRRTRRRGRRTPPSPSRR